MIEILMKPILLKGWTIVKETEKGYFLVKGTKTKRVSKKDILEVVEDKSVASITYKVNYK
jgi:homoaconitase/3-isopropylmalate dehydratase large subunit